MEVYDHFANVGKMINLGKSGQRKAIEEIGESMPEDLPTPNKSLKELKKETKKSKLKN